MWHSFWIYEGRHEVKKTEYTYKIKSPPAFIVTETISRDNSAIRKMPIASRKIYPLW